MQLQEFIQSTLIEISNAVKNAQQETGLTFRLGGLPAHEHDYTARIEFDVAVEVVDKTRAGKGGGIQIKVVKADLEKSHENSLASTSRIHFYVEKTNSIISHEPI